MGTKVSWTLTNAKTPFIKTYVWLSKPIVKHIWKRIIQLIMNKRHK